MPASAWLLVFYLENAYFPNITISTQGEGLIYLWCEAYMQNEWMNEWINKSCVSQVIHNL